MYESSAAGRHKIQNELMSRNVRIFATLVLTLCDKWALVKATRRVHLDMSTSTFKKRYKQGHLQLIADEEQR